jgi:hypothetical protein
MSRAQAVVHGVVSGLAVGLLAGLAVVNLENLREAAERDAASAAPAVVHGETYEGDGEREARLVQSEAERLVYVRTVAPSAQFSEGIVPGPFRLRTGTGFTLVLPARAEAYSLTELAQLAPDTLVQQADAAYLLSENVAVLAGATLDIRPPVGPDGAAAGGTATDGAAPTAAAPDGLSLRLSSDADGFATIVALGGAIAVTGTQQQPVDISSWDSAAGAADRQTADGRAYLRAAGGSATLSNVNLSDLGFWSGATGGLSLTGSDEGPTAAVDPAAQPAEQPPVPGGAQLLQPPSATGASPAPAGTAPAASVTGALDSVRLDGNAFGVFVSRAQGVTIRDSEVSGSLVDGIVLHRGVTGSRVVRTASHNNAVDGFRVSRSSTGNLFSGVTSAGNGRNGIFLDGQPLGTGPSSSGTRPSSGGDNRVVNSTFWNNARYGVAVSGGSGVVVADSRIDAGENGIVVDKAAGAVQLRGNTLRGQENQAIALRDGVENAQVRGNTISGVPTGIHLRNAGAVLASNELRGIGNHGVTLVGRATGVTVTDNTVAGSGSIAIFTENARGAAVSGNDLVGWRPAPSLESVTRSLFQPLTVVWLVVGLAILVTSLATVSHRRGGIRHPYAERVPLASFTSGVVNRDSLPHPH